MILHCTLRNRTISSIFSKKQTNLFIYASSISSIIRITLLTFCNNISNATNNKICFFLMHSGVACGFPLINDFNPPVSGT